VAGEVIRAELVLRVEAFLLEVAGPTKILKYCLIFLGIVREHVLEWLEIACCRREPCQFHQLL